MASAEPAVDLEHLDRYTGGDRRLNEEILHLFEVQCREMVATLEQLARENDCSQRWREVTHTLKGAARGVGAFSLAEAAAEAEKRGCGAIATLETLKERSAAVQRFIEAFLAKID